MRKFLTYFLLLGSLLFLFDYLIVEPFSPEGTLKRREEMLKNPRYLLAVEAYENEVILLDTTYFHPLDYQEVCTYLKSQSIKLADPPSKNILLCIGETLLPKIHRFKLSCTCEVSLILSLEKFHLLSLNLLQSHSKILQLIMLNSIN